MEKINKNSGQALLMVLLVVTVGLTIATSVFLESLNESAATIAEEESDKAFNAAEGEIERYLYDAEAFASGVSVPEGLDSLINSASGIGEEIPMEYTIKKNEVIELEITGIPIDIYWDEKDAPDTNLGVLVKTISNTNPPIISYKIYNRGLSISSEGMVVIDVALIVGQDYKYKIEDFPTSGLSSVRLMALGDSFKIHIPEGVTGYKVSSVGETESQISRGVELNKTGDYLPEVFDYSVYSAGGLSK